MSDFAWPEWLAAAAAARKERKLERRQREVERLDARSVKIDGREHLSFLSNDYLGLATHPAIKAAAQAAIQESGVGASASRLISGTTPEHAALERETAALLGMPAALAFTSGYHANLGVISALADQRTLILSDALNHASIIDGARLARAEVAIFRHADYAHARELAQAAKARRILIVSDGLFSIDGDLVDWAALNKLALELGALLFVDDAHGFGVLGPNGRGSAALSEIPFGDHLLLGGTYSKAAGALGGFVASSLPLREHLYNHARSLIFSTAGDLAAQAAARAALKVFASPEGAALRSSVMKSADNLRAAFAERGWESGGMGQIVPLWLGAPERATALADALMAESIAVAAIRPPTVPEGRSMLRISLSALHQDADIARLVAALDRAMA